MELGEVVLKFFDLMASTSDWLALNLSDLNHVFLLLLIYLVLNLPNLLLHSLAPLVAVSKFKITSPVYSILNHIIYIGYYINLNNRWLSRCWAWNQWCWNWRWDSLPSRSRFRPNWG